MTTRAMIDLETAGTTPGSLIWSIGVVVFNDAGLVNNAGTFHAYLDPVEQARLGMTLDPGTTLWWLAQKPEAQAALTKGANSVCGKNNAVPALQHLNKFLALHEVTEVWGNGADFDMPLLAALYRAAGYGSYLPWKYSAGRCCRTVFAAIGKRMGDFGTENVLAHDALQDAIYQALEVGKALAYIRNSNLENVIQLTPHEVESKHDRVRWAEGFIRQLPPTHDGRNSWLLNYGKPVQHDSDCALHNEPASPAGPCDCSQKDKT